MNHTKTILRLLARALEHETVDRSGHACLDKMPDLAEASRELVALLPIAPDDREEGIVGELAFIQEVCRDLEGEALDRELAESASLDAHSIMVGAIAERAAIVRRLRLLGDGRDRRALADEIERGDQHLTDEADEHQE